jgi:hypothetical protein
MATYLQGVTDYIPQFQPFQPDLNFYGNIMQTKQTQYDNNWQALNKMYGQYYHADLTRDENVEKKEGYLKNAEFELKRVSQLDLSLEQNVDQATQVFKPFYEDKSLMKDMAWTKNFNNQVGRAQALKGSYDEAERKQYWDDGMRAMEYKKKEFKAATTEDAMSFENAEYTPYINVVEKAHEMAKKEDLSIEKVEFGKFIIKTKNGESLTEPLQRLFEARLGNDPAVQAVYKTQAYVDRKDYAMSNAAQFNGDENAAEMKYLEDSFNILKEKNVARYKALQQSSNVLSNNIKDIESQIKNGTASPAAKEQLAQYQMNKEIVDKVLLRAEEQVKELNGGQSSTATTTTGFVNPYGDLKSLRWKVDNGMASLLMQKDLNEAAVSYAVTHSEVDVQANPFAILDEKQKNSMQLLAAREASSKRVADYKSKLAKIEKYEDGLVENGTHYRDEKGQIQEYTDQHQVRNEQLETGTSTDRYNMKNKSREIDQQTHEQFADPYFKSMFVTLQKAKKEGKITDAEITQILGYSKNPKITLKEFVDKYNTYGAQWARNVVGQKDLGKIRNEFNAWVGANRETDLFNAGNGQKTQLYKDIRSANTNFHDYMLYTKSSDEWKINTSKAVEANLKRQNFKYADFLYDQHGNLRSEKQFYDAITAKYGSKALPDLDSINLEKRNRAATAMSNILDEYLTVGNDVSKMGSYSAERKQYYKEYALAQADPRFQKAQKEYNKYNTKGVQDLDVVQKLPGAKKDSDTYNNLVNAAAEAYSNPKLVTPPVRITKGPVDAGTGLSSTQVSTITVNPKGNSAGKAYFYDVVRDLENFDWNGQSDRATFNGIGKGAYDGWTEKNRNKEMRYLLDAMKADMQKGKNSKLSLFTVSVSPIAGGRGNKAAIIIKPNREWVDQYRSSTKGKDNYLTNDQANALIQNGMSFMMDASKMKNQMYRSSFDSPLQAYVNTHEEGYIYNNIGGDPMKSYKIEKNDLGTGDYTITMTYPQYNPEKGILEKATYVSNNVYHGTNLESNRDQMIYGYMDQADEMNSYLYNNFTRID